jgi:hypothetical protein
VVIGSASVEARVARRRPQERVLRLVLLGVLCAATLVASKATVAAGAPPNFVCPAAPPGWTAAKAPGFWGPDENPGTDTEEITCVFANRGSKTVSVVVSYALPTDLRPFDDFFYGCGTSGAVAWDNTQRVYHLPSADRWALASFTDTLKIMTSADVPRFKAVARTMVDAAHNLAHTCSSNALPTQAVATWLFDFDFELKGNGIVATGRLGTHVPQQGTSAGVATYAVPDGSFKTSGSPANPLVTKLKAPHVTITLHDHGKIYTVTFAFTKGISFRKTGQAAAASLVAGVAVVHSSLTGCRARSQGTLTMMTAPATLKLDLCGDVFGSLKTRAARVDIETG